MSILKSSEGGPSGIKRGDKVDSLHIEIALKASEVCFITYT